MLVHVKYGKSKDEASEKGDMHFAEMPRKNDLVEVDGALCSVLMTWHIPSLFVAGTKAGILVHQDIPAIYADRTLVKEGVEA